MLASHASFSEPNDPTEPAPKRSSVTARLMEPNKSAPDRYNATHSKFKFERFNNESKKRFVCFSPEKIIPDVILKVSFTVNSKG